MSLAIRVIPCLDVDAGRVVKGVNFENLRDATGLRARAMMCMVLSGQGGQFITYSWTGTTSTRPWPWRADTAMPPTMSRKASAW